MQKAWPTRGPARPGCIRNPRAAWCSGCAPAEPYPPRRIQSLRSSRSIVTKKEDETMMNTSKDR